MDQKYLTDSESLSLNVEATCLLLSSPRNFPYEIKIDKYRPYPSMISMFTSDSQHPPRSRHAVLLGVPIEIRNANTIDDFGKQFFNMDGISLVLYIGPTCSHTSTAESESVSMVYRTQMYLNILL